AGGGEPVGDVGDVPPPASSNDTVNLLRDGLSGHGSAWILDRSLQPQRLPPALSLEAFLHQGAKLVADLGRVIDDRTTAALACLLNRCHVRFLIVGSDVRSPEG